MFRSLFILIALMVFISNFHLVQAEEKVIGQYIDKNVEVKLLSAGIRDVTMITYVQWGTAQVKSTVKTLVFVVSLEVINKAKLLDYGMATVSVTDNYGNDLDAKDCTYSVLSPAASSDPSKKLRLGDKMKKAFCTTELPVEGTKSFFLSWSSEMFLKKNAYGLGTATFNIPSIALTTDEII